jgi:methyl coenzyme M reductase subunit C-like uncharacterized protein (methanogenesis marker protein 7)
MVPYTKTILDELLEDMSGTAVTRPDVQTDVVLLTMRVKGMDADDYKKQSRLMKYMCGTIDMPLMLEANDTDIMKW